MDKPVVGVLGVTSLVGRELPQLLFDAGYEVVGFSRLGSECTPEDLKNAPFRWQKLPPSADVKLELGRLDFCICAAPIWILEQYLPALKSAGVRKVVAVSSTSICAKESSADDFENETVQKLRQGEEALSHWACQNNIQWVVLRPTLIYGRGRDKNISEIARLIRRLKFFPLLGSGVGLRQPVHAQDVALGCVKALPLGLETVDVMNICGGSTLSYRKMVETVFDSMGLQPRIVSIPLWMFSVALFFMRLLPRYRKWNAQMALRINMDLVFDDGVAREKLGFSPRVFRLLAEDVPQQ